MMQHGMKRARGGFAVARDVKQARRFVTVSAEENAARKRAANKAARRAAKMGRTSRPATGWDVC